MSTKNVKTAGGHGKAFQALEDKAQQQELEQRLATGTLDAPTPADAGATKDDGLTSFVKGAKKPKKAGGGAGKLSSQDVELETQRSKNVISAQLERANVAFEALRQRTQFISKYDDMGLNTELANLSLEQYLHRTRQRFNTERSKQLFRSNLDAAERLRVFEDDLDTMDPRHMHEPQPPTEEEIQQLGLELGLIRPDGGWKRTCDCEGKLEKIKNHVKLHERKLTKAKMINAFLNQIDSLVVIVDEFMEQAAVVEEQRLADVLDVKEKHLTLMATVQNQKVAMERLKRRLKDNDARAEEDAAEREAQSQLDSMKEYLASMHGVNRGGGKKGGVGDMSRQVHKNRMRRVMGFAAAHERELMGQHDTDGHEDHAVRDFLNMRKQWQKSAEAGTQTARGAEAFEQFAATQERSQSALPATDGAVQELRRMCGAVAPPTWNDEGGFTSETRLVEASVNQLARTVATTFENLELQRTRIMTQVIAAASSNADMCDELNPVFSHASLLVRELSNKASNDVKTALKRVALAAKDSVSRATSSVLQTAVARGQQEQQTFKDYVAAAEAAKAAKQQPTEAPAADKAPKAGGKKAVKAGKTAEPKAEKAPPAEKPAAKKAGGKKAAGKASPPPAPQSPSPPVADEPPVDPAEVPAADTPPPTETDTPASLASPTQPADADDGAGFDQSAAIVHGVPEDEVRARVAAAVDAAADKFNTMRRHILAIVHSLTQNDILDIDQGVCVDLELAGDHDETLQRVAAIAEQVQHVAHGGKGVVIPQNARKAAAQVWRAMSLLANNVQQANLALVPKELLAEMEHPVSLPERLPSDALAELLFTTERCIVQTALKLVPSVDAAVNAGRKRLLSGVSEFCGGFSDFLSQVGSLEKSTALGKSRLPRQTSTLTTTSRRPSQTTGSDAAGTPPPPAQDLGEKSVLDGFAELSLKSVGDMEHAVETAVDMLEPAAEAINAEIQRRQQLEDDLQRRIYDLEDELDDVKQRLADAEAVSDDDDENDGMTVFERAVVEDRNRIAGELHEHRRKLEQLEAVAERNSNAAAKLSEQLESASEELEELRSRPSVDPAVVERAVERHQQLLAKMIQAAHSEEESQRRHVKEMCYVSVVAIVEAFESTKPRPPTHFEADAQTDALVLEETGVQHDLDVVSVSVQPSRSPTPTPPATPEPRDPGRSVGVQAFVAFEQEGCEPEVDTVPRAADAAEQTDEVVRTPPPDTLDATTSVIAVDLHAVSMNTSFVVTRAGETQTTALSRHATPVGAASSGTGSSTPVDTAIDDKSQAASTGCSTSSARQTPPLAGALQSVVQPEVAHPAAGADSNLHTNAAPQPAAPQPASPQPASPQPKAVKRAPSLRTPKPETKSAASQCDILLPQAENALHRILTMAPAQAVRSDADPLHPAGLSTDSVVGVPSVDSEADDASADSRDVEATARRERELEERAKRAELLVHEMKHMVLRLEEAERRRSASVHHRGTNPIVARTFAAATQTMASQPPSLKRAEPAPASEPAASSTQGGALAAAVAAPAPPLADAQRRSSESEPAPATAALPGPAASVGDHADVPPALFAPIRDLAAACWAAGAGVDSSLESMTVGTVASCMLHAAAVIEETSAKLSSIAEVPTRSATSAPGSAPQRHDTPIGRSGSVSTEAVSTPIPGSRSQRRVNIVAEPTQPVQPHVTTPAGSAPPSALKPSRTSAPASPTAGVGHGQMTPSATDQSVAPSAQQQPPAATGTAHPFFASGAATFERLVTPAGESRPFAPTQSAPTDQVAERLSVLAAAAAPLPPPRPAVAGATSRTASDVPDAVQLQERPTMSSSRSGRPASRAPVDILPLLELHRVLLMTLREVLKRLDLRRVNLDDVFDGMVDTPTPAAVIAHDSAVLSSVHRLLHTDSRLTRRKMSTTVEAAAMQLRLDDFVARRTRREFPDHPQAAVFLDRQEQKLRQAVAKLRVVREQIAAEREANFREFFLPVSDVPAAFQPPTMLPRRRNFMPANPVAAAPLMQRSTPPPAATEVVARRRSLPELARTPQPTLASDNVEATWASPGINPKKLSLGALRNPQVKHVVPRGGVATFAPDRRLFETPLAGQPAAFGQRKSPPRRGAFQRPM